MTRYDKDELYLIVDFLEQYLEDHYSMYVADVEEDKEMLVKTTEVIKSLIKEAK